TCCNQFVPIFAAARLGFTLSKGHIVKSIPVSVQQALCASGSACGGVRTAPEHLRHISAWFCPLAWRDQIQQFRWLANGLQRPSSGISARHFADLAFFG